MDSQTIFAALRNALAMLYPVEQDARVVVDDAGLNAGQIAFSPRAQTNWHNILAEALQQHQLNALLVVAQVAYPTNPALQVAIADYHRLQAAGGRLDPPAQLPTATDITPFIENIIGADVQGLTNPYLGLRAFSYDDRAIYAGREQLAQETVQQLTMPGAQQTILFVTGASGSGKSSFAQAALIPLLETHYAAYQKTVRYAILRPSGQPMAILRDALQKLRPGLTLKTFATRTPKAQVNLLLIDQFEELFIQSDPNQRMPFCDFLTNLPSFETCRTHILITLRVDYLDELFALQALWEIAKTGVELRTMRADDLRNAIQKPLQVLYPTKRFAPELLDRLVQDAGADAALLPLLQVTLAELWKTGKLVLANYHSLTEAIRQRAEMVYTFHDHANADPKTARPVDEQQAFMNLLLDLINVSADSADRRDVRQRRTRQELAQSAAQRSRLIEELINARLLAAATETRNGEEVEVIDIIHESLIDNWARLREAIEAQRQQLQRRARFKLWLGEWVRHRRSADYLLLTSVQLAEARALADTQDIELHDPTARDFYDQSVEHQEAEQRRQLQAAEVSKLNVLLGAEQRITTGLRLADEVPQRALLLAVEGANAQRASNQALTISAENNFRDLVQQMGGTPLRAYEGAFTPLVYRSVSLVVSPNGHWFASAHYNPYGTTKDDPRIWLWALTEPVTPPRLLSGHTAAVTALAFSPNSEWLASASADTTIRLWKVDQSDTSSYPLMGHSKLVTAVSFSPDSEWLASAGQDDTVCLWKVASSLASPLRLSPQAPGVTNVIFSPSGHWLAGATASGAVQLWAMAEPMMQARLLGRHKEPVIVMAFSLDEHWLASGSEDGALRMWDVTNLNAKPRMLDKHRRGVWAVAFSPDGHWLASGSRDRTVLLWNITDLTAEPRILYGHEDYVTAMAFSPDGHWLASASVDKTVRLWDMTNPSALPQVLRGHDGHVVGIVFSEDGHWLISAGRDQMVRLWDMTSLTAEPRVLFGHEAPVTVVTFSQDGRWLASADVSGTARLWAVTNLRETHRLTSHQDAIVTMVFSPDSHWLASGSWDRTVRLWDMRHLATEPLVLLGHQGPITALAFSPTGEWLASASRDKTVRLWAVANLIETYSLTGHQDVVNMVTFSPDGQWLASASTDKTVWLWQMTNLASTLRPLAVFEGTVRDIAFSPNGQWLAAASEDKTIRLWKLPELSEIPILTSHATRILTIRFSPNSHWLVSASTDWTARLWDMTNLAAKPYVLAGHNASVLATAFSSDGHWLATTSFDRIVRLWDMTNPTAESRSLRGHFDAIHSVAFSVDGRWLASASEDKTVRLWTMPIEELIEKACRLAGRNLTQQEWIQYFGNETYRPTCPQWPIDT